MSVRASRLANVAGLAVLAVLALPASRHWLEADMARHMLLEFPLLMALGWAAARRWPRAGAALAPVDRMGFAGWLSASLALAFWMIPAALDAALADPAVEAAKLASLAVAGFALASAWQRSPPMVEAFFVGNFAWMTATVGLIYQQAEVQLCLNYLSDAQQRAGRGLVALAVACGVAWIIARFRRLGLADDAAVHST